MSHLLQVTQWDFKATQRGGTIPLALEFPVDPSTAPYLVMTSKGLLWVEPPLAGGQGAPSTVKTAVREADLGTIYAEIIQAVIEEGRAREWGNVQPLTMEGLAAALDHLAYYDLTSVDILVPATPPKAKTPPPPPPPKKKRRKKGSVEAAEVPSEPVVVEPPPPDLPEPEVRESASDLVKRMGLVGMPYQPCSWLPQGTIVVVPKDRTYLGVVGRVTVKSYSGLVHNASRGIAIAVGA